MAAARSMAGVCTTPDSGMPAWNGQAGEKSSLSCGWERDAASIAARRVAADTMDLRAGFAPVADFRSASTGPAPTLIFYDAVAATTPAVGSTSPAPALDVQEAGLLAITCVCGNVFLRDSSFCRKCGKQRPEAESVPCLYYPPMAGRGELARLIAAASGLQMDDCHEVDDMASFGSPGSRPCLAHGKLKIAQSFAIEAYIASIAPAFKALSPAQQAIDGMFCRIKEDMLRAFAAILSDVMQGGNQELKQTIAVREVAKVGDKWFPVLESRLPAAGFVNALVFPTVADLAVLNIAKAFMPFGAAYRIGNYDVMARFTKFAAHVARVGQHPSVKAYLDKSTTMAADPVGFGAPWTQPVAQAPKERQENSFGIFQNRYPQATAIATCANGAGGPTTSPSEQPAAAAASTTISPEAEPLPAPSHPPDTDAEGILAGPILVQEECNPALGATPAAVSDDSMSNPVFWRQLDERLLLFNDDRQVDMTHRLEHDIRQVEDRQLTQDNWIAKLDSQFQGLAEEHDRLSHVGAVFDTVSIVDRVVALEQREKGHVQYVKKALKMAMEAYQHVAGGTGTGTGTPRRGLSPGQRTPPVTGLSEGIQRPQPIVLSAEDASNTAKLLEKLREQDEALKMLQAHIEELQNAHFLPAARSPRMSARSTDEVPNALLESLEARLSGDLAEVRRQVQSTQEVVDQRVLVPLWQLNRQLSDAGNHVQTLSGQCQEFFGKIESQDVRLAAAHARLEATEHSVQSLAARLSLGSVDTRAAAHDARGETAEEYRPKVDKMHVGESETRKQVDSLHSAVPETWQSARGAHHAYISGADAIDREPQSSTSHKVGIGVTFGVQAELPVSAVRQADGDLGANFGTGLPRRDHAAPLTQQPFPKIPFHTTGGAPYEQEPAAVAADLANPDLTPRSIRKIGTGYVHESELLPEEREEFAKAALLLTP